MSKTKILVTNIVGFIAGAAAFVGFAFGINYVMVLLDNVPNLFASNTASTIKYILDIVFIALASSYVAYLFTSGIAKPTKKRMRPAVMLLGACLIILAVLMFVTPGTIPLDKLSPIFDELWAKIAVGAVGIFALIDGFPVRKKYKKVIVEDEPKPVVFKSDETDTNGNSEA